MFRAPVPTHLRYPGAFNWPGPPETKGGRPAQACVRAFRRHSSPSLVIAIGHRHLRRRPPWPRDQTGWRSRQGQREAGEMGGTAARRGQARRPRGDFTRPLSIPPGSGAPWKSVLPLSYLGSKDVVDGT